MPPHALRTEFPDEIDHYFGEVATDILHDGCAPDFAVIYAFLSDADAVAAALDDLEADMLALLNERLGGAYAYMHDVIYWAKRWPGGYQNPPSTSAHTDPSVRRAQDRFAAWRQRGQGAILKDEIISHLLSDALSRAEARHGFVLFLDAAEGRQRVQTLTRPLLGDEFRSEIRQGRH